MVSFAMDSMGAAGLVGEGCSAASLRVSDRVLQPPLVAGELRLVLGWRSSGILLSGELSWTRRTRKAVKMRARRPRQRKGTRSQKVAGKVGGKER